MEDLNEIVDWESGLVSPAIHFDDEVFRIDSEGVFDRAWLFVGHEKMVSNPSSYVTGYMGEVPVILTRDTTGEIHVLVNKCTHRGNQVCLFDRGKTRGFVCMSMTCHLVSNVIVDEISDSDGVEARSAFLVRQTRKLRDEAWWAGRRIDRLRRTDGSWKLARREVLVDATVFHAECRSFLKRFSETDTLHNLEMT
jgi:hypothetical protein